MMEHDDRLLLARMREQERRLRQYAAPVDEDEDRWRWLLQGAGYGLLATPLVWLLVEWLSGAP